MDFKQWEDIGKRAGETWPYAWWGDENTVALLLSGMETDSLESTADAGALLNRLAEREIRARLRKHGHDGL